MSKRRPRISCSITAPRYSKCWATSCASSFCLRAASYPRAHYSSWLHKSNQASSTDTAVEVIQISKLYPLDWTFEWLDLLLLLLLLFSAPGLSVDVKLSQDERISWIWAIFFCFLVPEGMTLFRCLRITFFRRANRAHFNLAEFCVFAFFETMHIIGLTLLVFYVLPNFEVLRSLDSSFWHSLTSFPIFICWFAYALITVLFVWHISDGFHHPGVKAHRSIL